MQAFNFPTAADIEAAHLRIAPWIHRTPVLTCSTLNEMTGAAGIWFKCENFQKVGAFKMRGAANAVNSLTQEQLSRGVATHSSGNHAQALALAARQKGARAWIVMPENAPSVKVSAVKGYGAEVIFCEATQAAREAALAGVVAQHGAEFVHPYNDLRVIAGQATAAKELIEDAPVLDLLITPVGGGGLLSGSALSARYFSPGTEVWAAEPAGADDAYRSFYGHTHITQHNPQTIADGLLTTLGDKTLAIIREQVRGIGLASEAGIVQAMRLIWERMKIIIEPSCALPLAAILAGNIDVKGKRVGIILSGGNVDLDRLPWMKGG